jgi:hypothetical protein
MIKTLSFHEITENFESGTEGFNLEVYLHKVKDTVYCLKAKTSGGIKAYLAIIDGRLHSLSFSFMSVRKFTVVRENCHVEIHVGLQFRHT